MVVAPVYPAGEEPIEGIDADALAAGLKTHGHRSVITIEGPEGLAPAIHDVAKAGDVVVCLGAGSITRWANALPDALAALDPREGAA